MSASNLFKLAKQLASKIGRDFPSLKKNDHIKVEQDEDGDVIITIANLHTEQECDAMIDDIESIVRDEFEGRIKEIGYIAVPGHGYIQILPIEETARIH